MKTSIISGGVLLAASILTLGALSAVAGTATELKPVAAQSFEIGGMKGVAYYTVEHDGYRVVATLADGEGHQPVRFIGTLAPGQKLSISVPRAEGVLPVSAEIARAGDQVFITPSILTQ